MAKAARSWDHVRHAWLVGVTDPTHAIPYDHVFVTGFSKTMSHIFCTRSPCIQPNRGRLLKLLTEKPAEMSPKHWAFLQRLDFGAIVFPNAPQGLPFLPFTISNGDLDGDLYFACWDAEILQQLSAFHSEQNAVIPAPHAPVSVVKGPGMREDTGRNWQESAQRHMSETSSLSEICMLAGICCKLSEQYATSNDSQYMNDPSAAAFASAYEDWLCCHPAQAAAYSTATEAVEVFGIKIMAASRIV